jgi:hypothetical protein
MSVELHDKVRLHDVQGAAGTAGRGLGLNGVGELLEVRSEQLPHIGKHRALPGNSEDLAGRRNIFAYNGASGPCLRANLMHREGLHLFGLQIAVELSLIGSDRSSISAKRSEARRYDGHQHGNDRKHSAKDDAGRLFSKGFRLRSTIWLGQNDLLKNRM